jgi:hypothetical protein
VPEQYPHIQTSLFVVQNVPDVYQLRMIGNGIDIGSAGEERGTQVAAEQTPIRLAYVAYVAAVTGEALYSGVMRGGKARTDGLFAPGCVEHCMGFKADSHTLGGLRLQEVVGNWYFGRDGPKAMLGPGPARAQPCDRFHGRWRTSTRVTYSVGWSHPLPRWLQASGGRSTATRTRSAAARTRSVRHRPLHRTRWLAGAALRARAQPVRGQAPRAGQVSFVDDAQPWEAGAEDDDACIWTLGDGAGQREQVRRHHNPHRPLCEPHCGWCGL